jgi:hypothetical protein
MGDTAVFRCRDSAKAFPFDSPPPGQPLSPQGSRGAPGNLFLRLLLVPYGAPACQSLDYGYYTDNLHSSVTTNGIHWRTTNHFIRRQHSIVSRQTLDLTGITHGLANCQSDRDREHALSSTVRVLLRSVTFSQQEQFGLVSHLQDENLLAAVCSRFR